MKLENKSILLLGLGFYDYEEAMVDALKTRFSSVYYANIQYKSFLGRILSHLNPTYLKRISNKYVTKQINNLPSNIDYIIIIKGETLDKEHITLLKDKYSSSRFLLYLWDSLIRIPNSLLLLENFDNIFTFDRKDAIEYNLKFRPLFYRQSFPGIHNSVYDISFVGEMHSNRYHILHKLKQEFIKNGIKYKFALYTGRYTYFINRYIKKSICKEDSDMFTFKKIPYKEYLKLSLSSRVILDIAHPQQTGLTIRTVESIGMGKKIMTNNRDIIFYESLAPDTYMIFDINNLLIDYSFFTRELPKVDNFYFSLDSFMDELIQTLLN